MSSSLPVAVDYRVAAELVLRLRDQLDEALRDGVDVDSVVMSARTYTRIRGLEPGPGVSTIHGQKVIVAAIPDDVFILVPDKPFTGLTGLTGILGQPSVSSSPVLTVNDLRAGLVAMSQKWSKYFAADDEIIPTIQRDGTYSFDVEFATEPATDWEALRKRWGGKK